MLRRRRRKGRRRRRLAFRDGHNSEAFIRDPIRLQGFALKIDTLDPQEQLSFTNPTFYHIVQMGANFGTPTPTFIPEDNQCGFYVAKNCTFFI